MMVIEVKHKIPLHILVLIMGYIYAWYELWIVVCLIRELRSSSGSNMTMLVVADHVEPVDSDPPAVIVLSPSPTPVTVYTIEGESPSNITKQKNLESNT